MSIKQSQTPEDLIFEIDFLSDEIEIQVFGKCHKIVSKFQKKIQQYEEQFGEMKAEFYDQVLKGFKDALEYGNDVMNDYEKLLSKLPPQKRSEYSRKFQEYLSEKDKLVTKFDELRAEQRKLRTGAEDIELETDWGLDIDEVDLEEQKAEDASYVDQMMKLAGEEDGESEEDLESQQMAALITESDEDSADDYVMQEMEKIMGKRELINEILGNLVKKSENIKKMARECADVVVAQNKKLDQIGAKLERLEKATQQLQNETMKFLRTMGRTKCLLICATCVVFLGCLVAIVIGFVIITLSQLKGKLGTASTNTTSLAFGPNIIGLFV